MGWKCWMCDNVNKNNSYNVIIRFAVSFQFAYKVFNLVRPQASQTVIKITRCVSSQKQNFNYVFYYLSGRAKRIPA